MMQDDAGYDWFARRGQQAESSSPFRVFADSARGGGLSIARIWHSAAAIHRQPVDGSGLTVLIQIEGDAHVRLPETGRVTALTPGSATLLPDDVPFSLSAKAATARVEIRLRHSLGLVTDGRAVTWEEHPYVRVLLATINAALSGPPVDPSSAGFAHLKAAIRSLLFAGVAAVPVIESESLRGSEAVLFQRAQAVIERDAVRPEFNVADLAAQLGVSQVYLRRVFSHAGTTPSTAIRAVRVRIARLHLEELNMPGSRTELERVARAAGFSSVRRMKETLIAWDENIQPWQDEKGSISVAS